MSVWINIGVSALCTLFHGGSFCGEQARFSEHTLLKYDGLVQTAPFSSWSCRLQAMFNNKQNWAASANSCVSGDYGRLFCLVFVTYCKKNLLFCSHNPKSKLGAVSGNWYIKIMPINLSFTATASCRTVKFLIKRPKPFYVSGITLGLKTSRSDKDWF